jgi:peptidoglycan hydrolase CwlO-like protein
VVYENKKGEPVFRFLFGFVVGLIVGTGGTGYFFSTAGGGDYLLSSSQRVQKLEQDLQRVSQERDSVTKRLEDTTNRIQTMAGRFDELERRFRALEESIAHVAKEEPKEKPKEQTLTTPPET